MWVALAFHDQVYMTEKAKIFVQAPHRGRSFAAWHIMSGGEKVAQGDSLNVAEAKNESIKWALSKNLISEEQARAEIISNYSGMEVHKAKHLLFLLQTRGRDTTIDDLMKIVNG